MKGLNHYMVKPYTYISIHDQLNGLHYELMRMTLDSLSVFWPDLPKIENSHIQAKVHTL